MSTDEEYEGTLESTVPVLRVESVARSIDWYGKALGFVPDAVGPPDDPVFAILRRDGVELMLQKVTRGVGGSRSAGTAGGGWDVYLRIDDVGSAREVLARRLPEVGRIVLRPYGCRELELTDPDGHVLVLGECG